MNKRKIKFEEFKKLVFRLCKEIEQSNWKPDYIVGISRGGLLPAVMISHYFNIPMKPLQVSLRDGECVSDLSMAEDAYNNKQILIVDDINDQGSTINWILEDWPSGCFPTDEKWKSTWNQNVKFAVVFDNLSSKSKISVDYWGEEINKFEEDVWIDFPYESWWD